MGYNIRLKRDGAQLVSPNQAIVATCCLPQAIHRHRKETRHVCPSLAPKFSLPIYAPEAQCPLPSSLHVETQLRGICQDLDPSVAPPAFQPATSL